jgi:hypothetical protein
MSSSERESSLRVLNASAARVAAALLASLLSPGSNTVEFDISDCLRISCSMPAFSMPQMRI